MSMEIFFGVATWIKYHHRAHHRVPLPWEAIGQRSVQDVRLHKHGASTDIRVRFQAWALHEDTPKVHVLSAASWDRHGIDGALCDCVVAANDGEEHM